MSIISRPVKTGGNTTYTDEVAAGNIHIKAVEVDADFDTIYNDYDGNITNDNLSPTANIATSKIAQDAGLQTGHLADNSVTSAKILDGTIVAADLAADAITTGKILDGSVTLAKMASGSTVRFAASNSFETSTFITGVETDLLTLASFTPSGPAAFVVFHTAINGEVTGLGATDIRITVKRNAVAIATTTISVVVGSSVTQSFCITIPLLQAFLVGAQVFTVTGVLLAAAGTVTARSGYAYVLEHA